MPKEQFKQEVERELTGRGREPWEIIYFKLYQRQMPVIERAIETACLMLGERPLARLLFGDDLCGLSGRGQPGLRRSGDAAVLDEQITQVSAGRAASGIS